MPGVGTSYCPMCKLDLPVTAFRPSKTRKSGHRSWCLECESAYDKKRNLTYKNEPIPLDFQAALSYIMHRISRQDHGYGSPCWIWQLGTDEKGYARTAVPGYSRKNKHIHRVTYSLLVGPIPEGLQIDHLCCVTSCVNPKHLEAVTPQENVRRQVERRRAMREAA